MSSHDPNPPAGAESGELDSEPVRVQARSLGDLVALVPYLTGYRLEEGLVVLVYQDGRIQLTASLAINGLQGPESVVAHLSQVRHRFPDATFIVVGFHSDRDQILGTLRAVQAALPADRVQDVIYTNNRRYWSLTCVDECCPPEGSPVDHHSPAAVQAVLAGAVAESSREAIAERVSGPSPAQQSRDWLSVQTLLERMRGVSCSERSTRLETLLDVGMREPGALSHADLLELACLLTEVPIRDQAWLSMTRANAEQCLAVWLRVIKVAPDHVAIPAVCLAGLAAWIGGQGALLTVCVERGEDLGVDYSLLDIVSDIQARAVPPSEWDIWRRDLLEVT